MTIVTKPISENKVDKEKPLVVSVNDGTGVECVEAGLGHDVDGDPKAGAADGEEGKKKTRRVGSVWRMIEAPTKIFVLVGAFCLLTCAIIYGIYIYRQYTHNQMSRLRVWCGVPFPLDSMPPHSADRFRFEAHKQASHWSSNFPKYPMFNEQFDLDLDTNSFEEIFVPDFGIMREGRFIHDLILNLTAIVDVSSERCFVFPLDYSQVATPRNIFRVLRRFGRGGFYEGNMIVIRETRRIIRPPVNDISSFGPYIEQRCKNFQTYRLVKVTRVHRLRAKRSSEDDEEEKVTGGLKLPAQQTDDHFTVVEFAGKNIIEYTIIDE